MEPQLHPQGKIMRVSSVDWKRKKLTESNLGEEMEIDQPTEHTTEQLGSILPHPVDSDITSQAHNPGSIDSHSTYPSYISRPSNPSRASSRNSSPLTPLPPIHSFRRSARIRQIECKTQRRLPSRPMLYPDAEPSTLFACLANALEDGIDEPKSYEEALSTRM